MKNSNQTKLIKMLDIELRALITEDLKRFKTTTGKNNQVKSNQLLAA